MFVRRLLLINAMVAFVLLCLTTNLSAFLVGVIWQYSASIIERLCFGEVGCVEKRLAEIRSGYHYEVACM